MRWLTSAILLLLAVSSGAILADEPAWKSLFDGKSLDGWERTNFGGEGDVYIQDQAIVLDFGSSLTGITYTGKPLPQEYELSLEAKRMVGNDFFCGLTFPVEKSHCSLILGGWGGAIVGLSSLDGADASENETRQVIAFEPDRWYRVKVAVTAERIQVWLDEKQIISQDIQDVKLSIRPEVVLSKPLGIATFDTKGAIRKIQYRPLAK